MILEFLLLIAAFAIYNEWRDSRRDNYGAWKVKPRKRRRASSKQDDDCEEFRPYAGLDYDPTGREQVKEYPRLRIVSGRKE